MKIKYSEIFNEYTLSTQSLRSIVCYNNKTAICETNYAFLHASSYSDQCYSNDIPTEGREVPGELETAVHSWPPGPWENGKGVT